MDIVQHTLLRSPVFGSSQATPCQEPQLWTRSTQRSSRAETKKCVTNITSPSYPKLQTAKLPNYSNISQFSVYRCLTDQKQRGDWEHEVVFNCSLALLQYQVHAYGWLHFSSNSNNAARMKNQVFVFRVSPWIWVGRDVGSAMERARLYLILSGSWSIF